MSTDLIEILRIVVPVLGGGIAVKIIDWLISKSEKSHKITLSDREELKKFIDQMHSKQEEMDKRIQRLSDENADLRVKLALLTQERADWRRERAEWDRRESELMERIRGLEEKVRSLEAERDARRKGMEE